MNTGGHHKTTSACTKSSLNLVWEVEEFVIHRLYVDIRVIYISISRAFNEQINYARMGNSTKPPLKV